MRRIRILPLPGRGARSQPKRLSNTDRRKRDIKDLQQQVEDLRAREIRLNKKAASLVRRNIKLEELNQIKDEFIGIASHQLRTPATGVKQYLNLLLDGFAEDLTPHQRLFIERAHESNDRQLRIIDDLLRVARIDSDTFKLRKTKVDIAQTLEVVISEFKDKLKQHRQEIAFAAPKNPVYVDGDAERLRMVFENILDNAINYSIAETQITVSVKCSATQIQVIIQDQGVGIARKDFPKLFQKFSRIPNPLSVEVGGTGLGLYWAYKVITLHSGSIDVKSVLGKGSSFIINLPRKKKGKN